MTNRQQTCHQMTIKEWLQEWPVPDNAVLTTRRVYKGRYIALYYHHSDSYVLMDRQGRFKIPTCLLEAHIRARSIHHNLPRRR